MSDGTAVVIGGSMAGLCAAAALAEHAARVVVLERDRFGSEGLARAGAPQARHVHALLLRGRRELDRLLPGFDAAIRARGALELNFGLDFAVLRQCGWQPRQEFPFRGLFASRALVESMARELVARRANVELRERAGVSGLASDGARVTGVRLDDGGELRAQLVVDAAGRASRAGDWLRALGIDPPRETVVDSHAAYASRWYRAPAAERRPRAWWWRGIQVDPPAGDFTRAAVLSPVEGGRFVLSVVGLGGHPAPRDEAELDAWLGAFRTPILAEYVRLSEPLTPVYGHRGTANRFRHYERWRAGVAGFAALGDAVAAFNPVYGQGMTSAAVSAGLLAQAVAREGLGSPTLPRRFFRAQARFLRSPWQLATGADFRVPGTVGTRPPAAGLVNRYLDAFLQAAHDDARAMVRMGEVINMLREPSALFAPGMVARVGVRALRRALAAAPADVPPVPRLDAAPRLPHGA